MIIKLFEQPIIAIHEAEIAGTVDGVIIKDNKISCIYHRNMENHFAIPLENAIIGSDAVMIQDLAAMTLASQNVKSLKSMLDVYNISGKHLGCLREIEVDEEMALQYISTEDYRIEVSKIVSYESIIVVDAEEAELEERDFEIACEQTVQEDIEADLEEDISEEEATVTMDIGPEIEWNDENHQDKENSVDNSELNVVRQISQSEEKEAIPGVDAKYAYLCGKQLLEGIEIEEILYEKGVIIGPDLIKHAIANNAIVKVIVNAED